MRQRSSLFTQNNTPVRGLLRRASHVPRILGCRLINQSALRGFATKAKQNIVKKGPIHKGNGIYTPHREKLFKLSNGYFILFLHKQAVSNIVYHFKYLFSFYFFWLVVHNPIAVYAVPDSSRRFCCARQEKPVLQKLPNHAANNDCTLVLYALPRSRLLSPHQPHGVDHLAWSDRQWVNLRLS